MPKRYTSGITDFAGTAAAGNLSLLDPNKYVVYHEDFSQMPMGGTTSIEASSYFGMYGFSPAADATITIGTDAGAKGACLKLGITNQDTTYARVQLSQMPGGMILASGKKAFMETNLEVTAATIAGHFWAVGMCTGVAAGDATAINDKSNWVADDSWMFFKEATAEVKGRSGENDVNVDASILATQVTAVWYKLSCYYDGTDMYWYLDDNLVAVSTPTIPVTPCAPIMMVQTGSAEACTMFVDYLTIAIER